jgi:hypothetical protein
MAPCAVLLVFNRRKLARLMNGMELSAEAAPQITRHLVAFALGGLKTLGQGPRSPRGRRNVAAVADADPL